MTEVKRKFDSNITTEEKCIYNDISCLIYASIDIYYFNFMRKIIYKLVFVVVDFLFSNLDVVNTIEDILL